MHTVLLKNGDKYFCILSYNKLSDETTQRLGDFLGATQVDNMDRENLGCASVCGPRLVTTSPWSSNMIQILQTTGYEEFLSLVRIEKFIAVTHPQTHQYDEMMEEIVRLDQLLEKFDTLMIVNNDKVKQEKLCSKEYVDILNVELGLALSSEEIDYLVDLFTHSYQRSPTLSEISIFGQLNSEHCRHKLFNGHFVIDNLRQGKSPFEHIKETYKKHPGEVLIAYKDNGSVIKGKEDMHPTFKAETHNHPSLIEPFNGGATGLGGCLRDAMAIGSGSEVDASSSAYFVGSINKTSPYKVHTATPRDILLKASAGIHLYGNTNATPLINGSVIAPCGDIQDVQGKTKAFAKPVILAGTLGRIHTHNLEKKVHVGDLIVKLGGPDYRIGIGGASASSVNSGKNTGALDFASVQRADPQMQIKVKKVIEILSREHPEVITVIHDYGAGGHGNCFFEILEDMGGEIDIAQISLGDPSLSYHEILINESQERMGLLIDPQYKNIFTDICVREACPFDVLGTVNDTGILRVSDDRTGESIIDISISDFLFNPENEYKDSTYICHESALPQDISSDIDYLKLLAEPTIGSKSFLVYHVDRSVNGKVVQSACCGKYQLPLSDYGLLKIDAQEKEGTLTSQGSRPFLTLIDPEAMTAFSLAEVILNASFVASRGLETISLSGNWMWPAKKKYQKATLYKAVEAVSRFAQELKINIPVGKDSVSMSVGDIDAPGALLLSLFACVDDTNQRVTPEIKKIEGTKLVYIPLAKKEYVEEALRLGIAGTSAVRLEGKIGNKLPVLDMAVLKTVYETIQWGIQSKNIVAGHDVSDGGGWVTLVEMFLGSELLGLSCSLPKNMVKNRMVSELPGVIVQVVDGAEKELEERLAEIPWYVIADDLSGNKDNGLLLNEQRWSKEELMGAWNSFSAEIEGGKHDESFSLASFTSLDIKPTLCTDKRPRVMVLRETGTNGEHDMTLAFSLAGFNPVDVTVTDLIAGRYRLDQFDGLALPGGFSFGDIPRAGAGFAFVLTQHPDLKEQFDRFFANPTSFSLSVCNGCQVMMEMGYITRSWGIPEICPMQWNQSKKFESRFLNVKIDDDDNIFFTGMKGAVLGIWVAHGEGYFDDSLQDLPQSLQFVDKNGQPSMAYPYNPNGSLGSRVALISKNGRHLAIMSHPERTILPHQIPFERYQEECFTWLQMFRNMREGV